MSKNKTNKVVVEPATEVVNDTPAVEEKVAVYIGKIRDCYKLNVREEPTMESKVLCKLDKLSEVQVDKANSTRDFYKIVTATGVNGYCMKKYMSIKKEA
jgi:uncharacterized protein YgiM (DUF1202 family)